MFLRYFWRLFRLKKAYFDYASITPIDRKVLSAISSAYRQFSANPASLYDRGVKATRTLENARKSVARILSGGSIHSVHADEIIFTSGGTESNNLAIMGVIKSWFDTNSHLGVVPHVVASSIEHPAIKKVIETLVSLKQVTATFIAVDEQGIVDLAELKDVFTQNKNIVLVSMMMVNNEIGTVQPLRDIAALIRKYRKENNSVYPYFHTDACQAPCYQDTQIDKLGVDLLTLDGGKIYGSRGTGCLYIKRKTFISPIMYGGSQEDGMRPGTENVPAIVGFAKALELVTRKKETEVLRLRKMQDFIYTSLPEKVFVNGTTEPALRMPNNINICVPGSDSEFLVFKADVAGIELSATTACQNKQEESRSYVVDALGKNCGGSSLRISMGQGTTWRQVKKLVRVLHEIVG